MTNLVPLADVRTATELLASRPVIRLVTEIDDNGAIPARRLAATFPDLAWHHLRRAIEMARAHGLVRTTPGAGLNLTVAGSELADLYDAFARWSRLHTSPAPSAEFSTRIRYVLGLLTPSLRTERAEGPSSAMHLPSAEAEADLAALRALLLQWLADNPRAQVSEHALVA
ncbi:regulator [Streptomyces buecherae]|uniref:regulator n=1 Tax=Streptomyces buecherae TaxID=2763006 RepID=UPI001C27E9CF|nr:regulator [Streptomyces buecherae]